MCGKGLFWVNWLSTIPGYTASELPGNLLEMQILRPNASFTDSRILIIELLSCPGNSDAFYNRGQQVRFSLSNYKGNCGSVTYYTGAVNAD